MPTYAYACTSCGHEFDVVQSITDAPLQTCELCGGPLRKVFHPVGVTFKGSGFYRTDSRVGSGSGGSATDGKKPSTKPADGAAASKKDGSAAASTSSKSDGGGSSSTTTKSGTSSS